MVAVDCRISQSSYLLRYDCTHTENNIHLVCVCVCVFSMGEEGKSVGERDVVTETAEGFIGVIKAPDYRTCIYSGSVWSHKPQCASTYRCIPKPNN